LAVYYSVRAKQPFMGNLNNQIISLLAPWCPQ